MIRMAPQLAMLAVAALSAGLPHVAAAQFLNTTVNGASCGISTGGNASNNAITCNYGLTPEQVQELTKAAVAGATGPLTDKVVELGNKLGLTQGAVVSMLRIIGEQDVPVEHMPQKLAEVAAQYQRAMKRLAAFDAQDDPTTRDLIARAQAAITDGRLKDADDLLDQAEQIEVAGARQAQEIAHQAGDVAARRLLRAANAAAVRGGIAETELRYLDAAKKFSDAAELVPSGHPDEVAKYRSLQAEALDRQGDEKGDKESLQASIHTWQLVLQLRSREQTPLEWANAQRGLGGALTHLGEVSGEQQCFEDALIAFKAALSSYSHKESSGDWLEVQNDIGSTLTYLGSTEAYPTTLETAVATFKAALAECQPNSDQSTCAILRTNLGNALSRLGSRDPGSERLIAAVDAYRAALRSYSPEWDRILWAQMQGNLAGALAELGGREGDQGLLKEAVGAYTAALEGEPRERVPLQWARTQYNIGNVLLDIGYQESGIDSLEKAAAAYAAALEEFRRDRSPLDWARTQHNLANAHMAIGKREEGTSHFEEAVKAYVAALEEFRPPRSPWDGANTLVLLGNALASLGDREQGTKHLEEAVVVYEAALKYFTPDWAPSDAPASMYQIGRDKSAQISNNLGSTLITLGKRENNPERFQRSIREFQASQAIYTRERDPTTWAEIQLNLGDALQELGELTNEPARLQEALTADEAALAVFLEANLINAADVARKKRDHVAELIKGKGTTH
jgi:tetratricopeptide (TPR) repeat protein